MLQPAFRPTRKQKANLRHFGEVEGRGALRFAYVQHVRVGLVPHGGVGALLPRRRQLVRGVHVLDREVQEEWRRDHATTAATTTARRGGGWRRGRAALNVRRRLPVPVPVCARVPGQARVVLDDVDGALGVEVGRVEDEGDDLDPRPVVFPHVVPA